MEENIKEMPLYQSHKKVWALKIKEAISGYELDKDNVITKLSGKGGGVIIPEREDYPSFEVSEEYMTKHQPKAGGYYVRYEDGYESWSPALVFEEGNTLVKDLKDEADEELIKDKYRLDALQKLGGNYGGWILRESAFDRGMRLHESTMEGTELSVRKAIDIFLNNLKPSKDFDSVKKILSKTCKGPKESGEPVPDDRFKYRKKPVVIEAFQLIEDLSGDFWRWPEWLTFAWNKKKQEIGCFFVADNGGFHIVTLEGMMRVNFDDWIIQGVKGKLYPCKPDIFAATYEKA